MGICIISGIILFKFVYLYVHMYVLMYAVMLLLFNLSYLLCRVFSQRMDSTAVFLLFVVVVPVELLLCMRVFACLYVCMCVCT